MVTFSTTTWLLLAFVGGVAVLAMLHGMAMVVRNQKQVHDTRLKVARLRRRYAAELAGEQDIIEVPAIEEEPPELAKAA